MSNGFYRHLAEQLELDTGDFMPALHVAPEAAAGGRHEDRQ